MKEVKPELLKEIKKYLREREKGEISLLSFFYTEVFGRELKINCGGCIEDGISHLKSFINKKTKPEMENFIWKGKKADCVIRLDGQMILINENTCTDLLAEAIEFNSKYSHLVERVKEAVVVEKKSNAQAKEDLSKLEVTILTSKEVKKEEEIVNGKKGKQKSK